MNKFSGSFGGSSGVLGGPAALNVGRQPSPSQIPVTVVLAPAPTLSAPSVNNYQGGFGGPAGVLVNEKFDKTSAQVKPTTSLSPPAPTFPTILNNKFSGNFGGASGVISNASPSIQSPTTLAQLPPVISDTTQVTANRGSQKYTGNFGGLPGILLPYDNSKN